MGRFHEMSAEASSPRLRLCRTAIRWRVRTRRARPCRMKEMRPDHAKRPARSAGHKADSCVGDYLITMSVPAWEGTSAQTPVGRSPAFSGALSTDGQP